MTHHRVRINQLTATGALGKAVLDVVIKGSETPDLEAKVAAALVSAMGKPQQPTPQPTPAPAPVPQVPASGDGGAFVTVSGASLVYRGQNITLRGVNANNVGALKVRVNDNFGSGLMSDINVGPADYAAMSAIGFNHVRFGISFNWWADNTPEQFFAKLDAHVADAKRNRLWFLPVLFTLPTDCYEGYSKPCPIWTTPAHQQLVRDMWVAIADHYKNEPAVLGYCLVNEPTPNAPPWSDAFWQFAETVMPAVDAVNKKHLFFVMSGPDSLFWRKMTGPGSDRVVYESHMYAPIQISHPKSPSPYTWPGTMPDYDKTPVYWDKEAMKGKGHPRADLNTRYPFAWGKANNVPVYMGEWGANNLHPNYVQYNADLADLWVNHFNAHHAAFVWRGNAHQWGIFPPSGPLVPHDAKNLEAIKQSCVGAVRPTF